MQKKKLDKNFSLAQGLLHPDLSCPHPAYSGLEPSPERWVQESAVVLSPGPSSLQEISTPFSPGNCALHLVVSACMRPTASHGGQGQALDTWTEWTGGEGQG